LALTAADRHAFDWIGDRYNAGRIADLLRECIPEDSPEWGEDSDISFILPEHVAWQFRDLAEEEGNSWPCFAADLAHKLNILCWGIV
jgi:hypothetical protein